jgi:hypothetical protein
MGAAFGTGVAAVAVRRRSAVAKRSPLTPTFSRREREFS